MAPKLWRESYSAKGMHALIDYHRSDILPSNVERLWLPVSLILDPRELFKENKITVCILYDFLSTEARNNELELIILYMISILKCIFRDH